MLVPIPALNDNYIWLYRRENFPVIVIDIPEITRLIPYLESNKLDVEAVLLTHNHDDHVQGVARLSNIILMCLFSAQQNVQIKGQPISWIVV